MITCALLLLRCMLQDWDKVAYDLQNLGFIPPDVGDEVLAEMSGPLGRILSQLSGGGGATKLNIDAGGAGNTSFAAVLNTDS